MVRRDDVDTRVAKGKAGGGKVMRERFDVRCRDRLDDAGESVNRCVRLSGGAERDLTVRDAA